MTQKGKNMTELLTKQKLIDFKENFDSNNIDHIKQLLYLVILDQALPEDQKITDFISELLSYCNDDKICKQEIVDPIEPWETEKRELISEFFSPVLQYLYFN